MEFWVRERYNEYVKENSVPDSGTAHSYARALDMLGPILKERTTKFAQYSDIWSILAPEAIEQIYEFVKVEQRKKSTGIFAGHEPSSYWKGGYYSAALGSFRQFLISHKYIQQHEERLWKIYKEAKKLTAKLSRQLEDAEFEEIDKIVPDKEIDFSSQEGKERLALAKTRVNQDFFRKMILAEYRCECCVTGLDIPEVLRASHIVGWAEDAKNRMNPANGLCLRHLISFDEKYRLILSPSLKERYTSKAFKEQFLKFEGSRIAKPERFCPDQGLLERHRGRMTL